MWTIITILIKNSKWHQWCRFQHALLIETDIQLHLASNDLQKN